MMTRKEQIAKKAAREAALATYKAILNPPVWKVAGTSFKTSPTWQDIAKAAAAASYGAIMKMAQAEPSPVTPPPIPENKPRPKIPETDIDVPDMGPGIGPFEGPKGKDDIFQADDFGITQIYPVDWHNVANTLQLKARPLYDWIANGAKGDLSEPAKVSAQEFANWVKTPAQGKANWATEDRWPEIVAAITSNAPNPKLRNYLLSV
jgi:hypothetical protein